MSLLMASRLVWTSTCRFTVISKVFRSKAPPRDDGDLRPMINGVGMKYRMSYERPKDSDALETTRPASRSYQSLPTMPFSEGHVPVNIVACPGAV